ncbi:hypothetical protein AB6D74_20035 [Vibrio cyclitrophicus]|uniref:hypothetical protein n=1 Tax=Vibrio cyclitrophicus TaxID=47951 RepID=UPI000C82A766|nr:hypothetical protein [Vibrio cyclitrophicus]PMI48212.1 hypothetical protein BCU44_21475 [Vibrio cyclitrophicus]
MSIKMQVEDAIFLKENGRHLGALTNLVLAVAASSRKTFPKGTKSFENPKKEMKDWEAFTLFIGGRIRKILFGDFGGPETGNSGISVNFKGKQHDVAYILYKYYRCELIHEGELPEDIEFKPSENEQVSTGNSGLSISISCGNTMVLDYGWIDLLVNAVVYARCNGKLFGIEHFDMIPKQGTDADICDTLVQKHDISEGRFEVLKHAVMLIKPNVVLDSNDNELQIEFKKLVDSNTISGGSITGLSSKNLTDRQGLLLSKGIEACRDIASCYELTEA